VFLVRASVQDGLGHLIRSLCVLRELAGRAAVHLFVLGDRSGAHLIDEAAIPCTHCGSDAEAADLAVRAQPRVAVFDTLAFDAQAFARIASHAVTVSLSPEFSQMTKLDHLFHRTVNEPAAWARQPAFPAIHKGLQYTVLPSWLKRMRTEHYREHLEESRLGVAISMGGSDGPNVTLELLRLFGESPLDLVMWVALGDAYMHSYLDLLHCAAANRREIILLKSNDSMWRVLRNASVVICAGGLTTYEAAYIGMPTINLVRHADWRYLFDELAARGACLTLPPAPDRLARTVSLVAEFAADRERLMEIHLATKGVIPEGGAARIAGELLQFRREERA
jgi:spore coat polysaccharide biosynthesis predicted glycosyltransferase SpsG